MVVVRGVPATVVHVVDVIPVRDRDVPASRTVHVIMRFVHGVAGGLAFVVVTLVQPMYVTVVHVVDVTFMWDRDVPASFAVRMIVFKVFVVECARHLTPPPCGILESRTNWRDYREASSMPHHRRGHQASRRPRFIGPLTVGKDRPRSNQSAMIVASSASAMGPIHSGGPQGTRSCVPG